MNLPPQTKDLYGLPLDRFTSERDALAKQIRASGDKEGADAVKSLRKPALSMWALNQAVRLHPHELRLVIETTAKVRGAQRRLMGGGGAERFRSATAERDHAISLLTAVTASILEEDGSPVTRSQTDAISGTLRALATDDDLRAVLEAGMLTKPVEPGGFGDLTSLTVVADDEPDPDAQKHDPEAEHLRLLQQAERARDRAAQEAADASHRWMKANEEAERLRKQADEAERRAAEVSEAADAAARKADDLRSEAEATRGSADAAEADLATLNEQHGSLA
jgi:hypothetical protein